MFITLSRRPAYGRPEHLLTRGKQGQKWEVVRDVAGNWYVSDNGQGCLILPKSEYQLCKPVKVWRDVTAECAAEFGNIMRGLSCGGMVALLWSGGIVDGYRVRKVRMYLNVEDSGQWTKGRDAFIVEHEEEVR